MHCFSLSLLPSGCHVSIRFSKPSFIIMCYRNNNCRFLMLSMFPFLLRFLFKTSSLLTCYVHGILSILLVEPHFCCLKSLLHLGGGLFSIHCSIGQISRKIFVHFSLFLAIFFLFLNILLIF